MNRKNGGRGKEKPARPDDGGAVHPLLVGIGASAGGLNAFRAFLKHMPADSGMSFVLIQHLAPNHKSIMAELLSKTTDMTVVEAKDGEAVAPNTVYVIPPDTTLTMAGRTLRVVQPAPPRERRRPIDTFFSSLAEELGENAVCIVLSGTGSDGTMGLKTIKEHGGLAMAQAEIDHAAMSGMPHSAVATGLVDEVLPVEQMPAKLIEYQMHMRRVAVHKDGDGTRRDAAEYIAKISALLRSRLGHDFSKYKEKTLVRRIQRRMQVLRIDTMPDYLARLKEEPYEVELLFREFLIGVTHFFRDPAAFTALERALLKLVESKDADGHVRIWVPACASGEEAYSIAILATELMERTGRHLAVQIFATDIDDAAVTFARQARYRDTAGLSAERLARWFEQDGAVHCPIKRIRSMCVFSTHSVVKDPPFSKLDLISCRNLLIYLDADLQDRVLQIFHYALSPDGLLFLGTAEGVTRVTTLFSDVDKKYRIYRRKSGSAATAPRKPAPAPTIARPPPLAVDDSIDRNARLALGKYSLAYLVVDQQDHILRFSGGEAGRYLEPSSGAASLNLFAILRKGLRRPVRAAVTAVRVSRKAVVQDGVSVEIDGEKRLMRIIVEPLNHGADTGLCVVALQEGIGAHDRGDGAERTEGTPPGMSYDALQHELNATKAQLQSAVEELDMTTEEMRSAAEEYQSVNEELQSSNEELETAKEEMQSVNEELQTVNAELLSKADALVRVNSDLKNLLDSTKIATIFLDGDLKIKNFTAGMVDIFRLREGDVGRPITEITSRMTYGDPKSDLASDVREVLRDLTVIERDASIPDLNMSFVMRMRPYRTVDNVISGVVLTFVDITDRKKAEEQTAVLLAELDHRVKNILAVVNAVVGQTWKSSATPAAFKTAVEGRIAAIARTHGLVMQRGRIGEASLNDIVKTELAPHDRAENLSVSGDDIVLKSRAAMALAMAIHELASNAAKYGSLSTHGGHLSVEWATGGDAADRTLHIMWTETGGPAVSKPTHSGFGSKLIEMSLVHELDAVVKREFLETGLRCVIDIPLSAQTGYLGRPGGDLR